MSCGCGTHGDKLLRESLLLRVPDLFPCFDFILRVVKCSPRILISWPYFKKQPPGNKSPQRNRCTWPRPVPGCVGSLSRIQEAFRTPPQPWSQTQPPSPPQLSSPPKPLPCLSLMPGHTPRIGPCHLSLRANATSSGGLPGSQIFPDTLSLLPVLFIMF